MQNIIPCLWFDDTAEEAAHFYTSIFPHSKISDVVPYTVETPSNKPIGSVMTVAFELDGYRFLGLNGGADFKPNPSISFMINFDPSQDKDAKTHIDVVWAKLSEGGKILMPLDKYPFSERYGWVQDKFGFSWQLILTNPEGEERPLIIPSIMFVGDMTGKAEEASYFYLSVFKNSKRGAIARYPAGMEPDKESTVMFTDFKLEGQWFAAMDSGRMHDFKLNEAISLMITCSGQKEIDYFYDRLSAHPDAEICGWLKDKYGVSWQLITPDFVKLDKNKKVMEAILKMKRLDVAKLKKAYEG